MTCASAVLEVRERRKVARDTGLAVQMVLVAAMVKARRRVITRAGGDHKMSATLS